MGRYATLDGATVTNIIEADADFATSIGAVPAEHGGTTAQIGGGWDGNVFSPPPGPSLADAKAAKSTAVQAEKVRVRDGGFLVGGVLFDSDAGANVAYLNYFTRVSADPAYVVTNWKASTGVWVEMTAALFAQVSSAFGANSEAAFIWQAARDAEIAAATTVEQVQAISEHYDA